MDEITQSKQYPADIYALWDVTEQDFRNINSSTIKALINISKQYPERGNARVAFIAKENLAFGMLRMYEITSGFEKSDQAQNLNVFRSYSEGEKWLISEE